MGSLLYPRGPSEQTPLPQLLSVGSKVLREEREQWDRTVNSPVCPYKVRRDIKSRSPLDGKVVVSGNLSSMIPACLCAAALSDPSSSLLARPCSLPLPLSLAGSCSWGASLHSDRGAWAVPFRRSTNRKRARCPTRPRTAERVHGSAILRCEVSYLSSCLVLFVFATLYINSDKINLDNRTIIICTINSFILFQKYYLFIYVCVCLSIFSHLSIIYLLFILSLLTLIISSSIFPL